MTRQARPTTSFAVDLMLLLGSLSVLIVHDRNTFISQIRWYPASDPLGYVVVHRISAYGRCGASPRIALNQEAHADRLLPSISSATTRCSPSPAPHTKRAGGQIELERPIMRPNCGSLPPAFPLIVVELRGPAPKFTILNANMCSLDSC